ncbi:hypothetical protein JTB14_024969 [Gonioctena quinquepunctata]|nr:hypothetical protein JTB14_024969 [Gonioctena quinquepunctata]
MKKTLVELDIINRPSHIHNMNETGIQLNNKPEYVIAGKGSKNIAAITKSEKVEIVTVICCRIAEGTFYLLFVFLRERTIKQKFEVGIPTGSKVTRNVESAYVNTDIFLDWSNFPPVQLIPP